MSAPVAARAAPAVGMPQVLRYGMHVTLHVTGSGDQGGEMDITWTGDANLMLTRDRAGACYTPRFEDDRLAVNVENFRMVGASGTAAELTSPRSYEIPIGAPKLNYCDAHPVLQVAFNTQRFPTEEISAEGQTRSVMLFGNFLMGVLVVNNLSTEDANVASTNANVAPSDSVDPQTQGEMQALQSIISQHQGDAHWLMSPQGQRVIAQLQADAVSQGVPDLPTPQHSSRGANRVPDFAGGFASAKLPWTKGARHVVDDRLLMDKDGQHIELDIDLHQESAK